MSAFSQTIYSDVFSWMKSFVFWLKFYWSLFLRVQLTVNPALVNNGLVLNKRQVTILTNAESIHWRIYAALGGDELTHWPPGDVTASNFISINFLLYRTVARALAVKLLSGECHRSYVTGAHQSKVNAGSGNDLVPSGSKPLPEPMLTDICIAMWHQ